MIGLMAFNNENYCCAAVSDIYSNTPISMERIKIKEMNNIEAVDMCQ